MKIPLASPDITPRDIQAVVEVLNTTQLSIGPKVVEFENAIAKIANRKHGIAVNSGTSGLHLIVRSLGIADGDEVITTPFSFIASSNCILFERAKPVFVDIDPLTLNIDPDNIEKAITSRTKAILSVDAFGQPADLETIAKIASKYRLKVIEDSCEALGAEYKGRPAGSFGDAAVFAFYPNKQITTGEGGVIVTDDDELAILCRSMRNQGRGETDHWLAHERLGFNYRLDELSAALGLSQLSRLTEILDMRENAAARYTKRLASIEGLKTPYIAEYNKISWFVYVIQLEEGIKRDSVLEILSENGVGCRPYFTPIHLQPFYRKMFGFKEGDYPVTEKVTASTVALPFFNHITDEQIEYVAQNLESAIKRSR